MDRCMLPVWFVNTDIMSIVSCYGSLCVACVFCYTYHLQTEVIICSYKGWVCVACAFFKLRVRVYENNLLRTGVRFLCVMLTLTV